MKRRLDLEGLLQWMSQHSARLFFERSSGSGRTIMILIAKDGDLGNVIQTSKNISDQEAGEGDIPILSMPLEQMIEDLERNMRDDNGRDATVDGAVRDPTNS